MQYFHYNYSKNKCGGTAEMLLNDTDSFMYKIESQYVMKTSTETKSYLT